MKAAGLFLLLACAHAPRNEAPVEWPLGKQFEAYVAADDSRALRFEAPGGPLRIVCNVTGEGSYARFALRRLDDSEVVSGACGDKLDLRDLPAGPYTVFLLVISGPGVLHFTAAPPP
jgi:hypothetical protein